MWHLCVCVCVYLCVYFCVCMHFVQISITERCEVCLKFPGTSRHLKDSKKAEIVQISPNGMDVCVCVSMCVYPVSIFNNTQFLIKI